MPTTTTPPTVTASDKLKLKWRYILPLAVLAAALIVSAIVMFNVQRDGVEVLANLGTHYDRAQVDPNYKVPEDAASTCVHADTIDDNVMEKVHIVAGHDPTVAHEHPTCSYRDTAWHLDAWWSLLIGVAIIGIIAIFVIAKRTANNIDNWLATAVLVLLGIAAGVFFDDMVRGWFEDWGVDTKVLWPATVSLVFIIAAFVYAVSSIMNTVKAAFEVGRSGGSL